MASVFVVERSNLTPKAVEVLFAGRGILDFLVLDGNPLGDRGAFQIAECEETHYLRYLYLRDCGLTPAGRKALQESPHLAGLATLSL